MLRCNQSEALQVPLLILEASQGATSQLTCHIDTPYLCLQEPAGSESYNATLSLLSMFLAGDYTGKAAAMFGLAPCCACSHCARSSSHNHALLNKMS